MAMYRMHMRPRTHKDTQGAADLVRYLQREGEFAPELMTHDADVAYMTRQSADTALHDDLVGEPLIGNLPAWAHGNAGVFFHAASAHERANGQYAIAFQIALPRALTHEQHMALAQDFVEAVMHDKPYLLVKHEPVKDGQAQPHLHILMSPRTGDGIERDERQFFRRWNAQHPERGGAQKERFWNQRHAPDKVREAFADLANLHLEKAGVEERIDPRSLRKRGIERERISWNNPLPLDAATLAREQAQARAAWEQRKVYKGLGDIPTIPREEFVLLVRGWTREHVPGTALPRASATEVSAYAQRSLTKLRTEEQELRAGIQHLTEHLAYVRGEHARAAPAVDLDKCWPLPLIGNRLSRIYHTPAHKNYGDVHPQNQELFWTERAAQQAGYRRARNDHYGTGSGVARTASERLPGEGAPRAATRLTDLARQVLRLPRHRDDEAAHGQLRVRLHVEDRDRGMSW